MALSRPGRGSGAGPGLGSWAGSSGGNSRAGRAPPPRDRDKALALPAPGNLLTALQGFLLCPAPAATQGSRARVLFVARLVCILLLSCAISTFSVSRNDSEHTREDLSDSRRTDRHLVLPCSKERFASWKYPDQKMKRPGTVSPAAMFRGFPNPPSAPVLYISLCFSCILPCTYPCACLVENPLLPTLPSMLL